MINVDTMVEVIVAVNTRDTDRVFHYEVPFSLKDKVQVGVRVQVPFNHRLVLGYVVGFGLPESHVRVKEIVRVIDPEPVFTPELLTLARWMADNYLCSMAEALQHILSPRLRSKGSRLPVMIRPAVTGAELDQALLDLSPRPKQASVLRQAADAPGLTRKDLAAAAGVTVAVVDTLIKKGLLLVEENRLEHSVSGVIPPIKPRKEHILNSGQQKALEEITREIGHKSLKIFLLHGVTGSGKTEVYIRAAAAALAAGRQAVVLVPEIALTPQMVHMFRERFGRLVAVLHSALADGERFTQWQRIISGATPVVLGARSAVFAPTPDTGLFVVDEEHESSYKQDDHLRYHAREVAIKRAQLSGGVVLLGSATPSLESRLKTREGGPYRLLKLADRIDDRPLPTVRIVDMRQELKEGNKSIFSRALLMAVNRCLTREEQVLLFLNRRGYANFVICQTCGEVLKCPRCDISLTYHHDGRLRCHYCNHNVNAPKTCPGCGREYIRYFGAGTQKVEEEARRFFPDARILRMDSDTTGRRGAHGEILGNFRERKADILIGTQMIAKGLDFPGVTLVGVINSDTTLNMPDFRAAERTFQLLTQVAGRAGRGELPGTAIVQTYNPMHYSITAAAAQDNDLFYLSEMPMRRSLDYPPFSHLARLLFTHELEDVVKKGAEQAKEIMLGLFHGKVMDVVLLGPAPATLSRIKDRHRWQLVLKSSKRQRLLKLISESLPLFKKNQVIKKLGINVDINPQGML
ncbi:MAG: primosomal protein N' [Peptococcaceae bacterium]|nr:primosomal protein N' [Peptococcaceae bacterium]